MTQQFSGLVQFLNSAGEVVLTIDPDSPNQFSISGPHGKTVIDGGALYNDSISSTTLRLDSRTGLTPGSFEVMNPVVHGGTVLKFDAQFAVLDIGDQRNEGDLRVRDNANRVRLHIDGGPGVLLMTDASENLVLRFDTTSATLDIGNPLGPGGDAGDLRVYDGAGNVRIHLDGATGEVRTFGADCAEDFAIDPSDQLEPGTVVILNEDELLRLSTHPYDRRVVGIMSGAGGVRPGLILGREPGVPNRLPLTLTGKAWCKVDATYGPIALGDPLTTSSTPGYAMIASDSARAFGSIIGKALRPWSDGLGMVPVLVARG
jgi:hypothetical protein